MSTNVTFNGSTYIVPAIADASWGTNVANYLIAISTGCLQKTGGAFTLSTADVDFGATYGLKSAYYKSRTSNVATAGTLLLAKTDTIGWRNNANGGNLALGINASDKLIYNSIVMADISSAQTLTNKTFDSTSTMTGINMASWTPDSGSHTLTAPAVTDTLAVIASSQTFTNKLFSDSTCRFANVSDSSKRVGFSLGGATTGKVLTILSSHTNNQTVTIPDVADTFEMVDATQSPTNKTFNSTSTMTGVRLASFTPDGTHTLTAPSSTDTLVARATTDTLTNKTLSGNTAVTLISGSGTLTLNTSGTMTLPNATDTVVGKATTDTLTNKTLTGNTAVNLISGSGTLTLNTTGTVTLPNATDTLVGKATTDTLTNKTLSGNTAVTLISGSGTLTLNTTGTMTLPNATDTVVGKATTDTLTNKTATLFSISSGSYIDMLVQAAMRFNDDAGGDYVALKAPTGVTTHTLLLPATQGAASTVLTNDGSGNLSWGSSLTTSLNQFNTFVGNASNVATAVNTNLIGDIQATTVSQSYTVTSAAPGVFTVAAAPATGTKAYVTATQNGFTLNTTYYVTNVSGTTFKLATTLANAIAGTNITSSGTTAGTVISGGLAVGSIPANVGTVGNVRASAGSGTDTLILVDKHYQIFNLSAARTCVLPTTGILAGETFTICNQASQNLTIQASGGQALTIANSCNLDATIEVGQVTVVALQDTPTTAAHWYVASVFECGGFANDLTASNFPTTSIQFYFQRNNRQHSLHTQGQSFGTTATGTVNSTLSQALSNMPARLYPTNTVKGLIPTIYTSNAQSANPGLVIFPTSGAATIYASPAGASFAATNGQTVGITDWHITFDRLS